MVRLGDIEPDRFIEVFVPTFLATWAANRYADACARGTHDELVEGLPVEDAEELAKSAWIEYRRRGER